MGFVYEPITSVTQDTEEVAAQLVKDFKEHGLEFTAPTEHAHGGLKMKVKDNESNREVNLHIQEQVELADGYWYTGSAVRVLEDACEMEGYEEDKPYMFTHNFNSIAKKTTTGGELNEKMSGPSRDETDKVATTLRQYLKTGETNYSM